MRKILMSAGFMALAGCSSVVSSVPDASPEKSASAQSSTPVVTVGQWDELAQEGVDAIGPALHGSVRLATTARDPFRTAFSNLVASKVTAHGAEVSRVGAKSSDTLRFDVQEINTHKLADVQSKGNDPVPVVMSFALTRNGHDIVRSSRILNVPAEDAYLYRTVDPLPVVLPVAEKPSQVPVVTIPVK